MHTSALPAAAAGDSPALPDAKAEVVAKAASPHFHRPHPHGWWLISGVALIGLIVCASIAAILNSRERALSLAEQQLQNLAFVLAAHRDDHLRDHRPRRGESGRADRGGRDCFAERLRGQVR